MILMVRKWTSEQMNLSDRRNSELNALINSIFTSHFKENQLHSMQIKVADTGTFIRLSLTEVFFINSRFTPSKAMSV